MIPEGRQLPARDRVLEVLEYDKELGVFRWRRNVGRGKAGQIAGTTDGDGYRRVILDGVSIAVHRLVWFVETEAWPTEIIDHKNRRRDDNRFGNLREVTHASNIQNSYSIGAPNKTGFTGVRWRGRRKAFEATIKVNGRVISLGCFDTAEAAHGAWLSAKQRLHDIPILEAA